MDGIPALDMWDLIVAVLGNTNQSHKERGDPYKSPQRKKIPGKIDDLNSVGFVLTNAKSSHEEAML